MNILILCIRGPKPHLGYMRKHFKTREELYMWLDKNHRGWISCEYDLV